VDHALVWGYDYSSFRHLLILSLGLKQMPPGSQLQESNRAGSPTNPSESPAHPERGKSQALRTALWGLGIAILSNIANILKQLKDIIESLIQLEQFLLEHVWVSVGVISFAIVVGNVLLFRFLNSKLKLRFSTTYKVLAPAGSLAIVSAVLLTNWFSLQNLLQNPAQVQTKLASEVAATQDIDTGAFRNATTANGLQDTWTTAQSLKALLTAGTYDPSRIKKAFSYIESKRRNEGFEVIAGSDTPPFVRTEIASWVAIAYLQGLPRSDLWNDSERTAAIGQVERTLLLLVSQQDRGSGGWSPVPRFAATRQRTYATMMAVWALAEALLSQDISKQTKEQLGAPFESGISWLISHYVINVGWEEDPNFPVGRVFPGLTYQVLFVLERAQTVKEHNAFQNTEAYRRVKRELKNTLRPAQVADISSVPTAYMMVGEYPCWVDVAAYPWLVSILPMFIADPDVSSENRNFLKKLLNHELGKVNELPHVLEHAETWQVAEDLLGVSNSMNSNRTIR
jgi:hypothetical protein